LSERPDVIVVVLDTARTFDVSAIWPDGPSTTPALERMAAECLVFPQATTPSCWTLPARASLFTGLTPSRHGAHELSMRLPDWPPTLAEVLSDAGYQCIGVCCNDLVCPETGSTRGFARFLEEVGTPRARLRPEHWPRRCWHGMKRRRSDLPMVRPDGPATSSSSHGLS